MNTFEELGWQTGNAICYSGFREGQAPGLKDPSYEEIKEDLLILKDHWKYLRLYDCDAHSETVLKVITQEKLDFQVMLGAYIIAEMNNAACPWGGGTYSKDKLAQNKIYNDKRIQKLISLGTKYSSIINCLSVGNEACVDWTDHYVSVNRVIEFTRKVQQSCNAPVTFCENYLPWLHKLKPLVEAVDIISIHTYPVWEYKHIHDAIEYTKENYYAVSDTHPNKPVVITEAGWATNSNGRGIDPHNVNEEFQKLYYNHLMEWTQKEGIICYVFEAFDEPWKGSPDPMEPEKHWGLFHVNRTPKLVASEILAKINQ